MKKMILLFLCCFVYSCPGQDKLLRLKWSQYDKLQDAENVDYFVIYKWSGDTSATFHVDSLVMVDTVQQMVTVQKFERTAWFPMEKWIRAAAIAYDSLGRKSPYAFTRFYMPPERPDEIWIEQ